MHLLNEKTPVGTVGEGEVLSSEAINGRSQRGGSLRCVASDLPTGELGIPIRISGSLHIGTERIVKASPLYCFSHDLTRASER